MHVTTAHLSRQSRCHAPGTDVLCQLYALPLPYARTLIVRRLLVAAHLSLPHPMHGALRSPMLALGSHIRRNPSKPSSTIRPSTSRRSRHRPRSCEVERLSAASHCTVQLPATATASASPGELALLHRDESVSPCGLPLLSSARVAFL